MTLTAKSPEDVLAMVPVVLGFTPTDSLVMLTFGAASPFHARVDLPDRPREVREVVASLLEPVARHGVSRVLLVGYADDLDRVERVTGEVRDAFERAGVEVLGRLVADGARWWHLPREDDEPGTAYDVSAHPFAAEAVWRGFVTHGTRTDLAATMALDPAAVAETERALAGVVAHGASGAAEAAWAAGLVRQCVATGSPPPAAALARLLAGMTDVTIRDAAWFTLGGSGAEAHVAFWTDVVRRCPPSHVPAPASVLGFAAWISGQGALAWCAVDRAREAAPDYPLAGLLAEVLTSAMPPSAWERILADHEAS